MKQRQAVTAMTVPRYHNGSKKVKRQILDEFCETTGYSRGYARLCCVIMAGKCCCVGEKW